MVKNLLQVCSVVQFFHAKSIFLFTIESVWYISPLPATCQYYIFAYVDAPAYQILKNLNIISTGVLYRIILKKK